MTEWEAPKIELVLVEFNKWDSWIKLISVWKNGKQLERLTVTEAIEKGLIRNKFIGSTNLN